MDPGSNNIDIVIDTDCAVDDLRAITMLLALQDVNIKAIITSDGTLSPQKGALKAAALLESMGKTGIPVGAGIKFNQNPPFWREFNSKIFWGEESKIDISTIQSADMLLHKVFAEAKNEIALVCLGPLSNIACCIKQSPEYAQKIRYIIWYVESVYPQVRGSNYNTDINSADQLLHSGIRFFCISSLGKPLISIDEEYISTISSINTIYANAILNSFMSPGMDEKLRTRHLKLWDDLVPLFMVSPHRFKMNILTANRNIFYTVDFDILNLKTLIFSILSGSYIYKQELLSEYPQRMINQQK